MAALVRAIRYTSASLRCRCYPAAFHRKNLLRRCGSGCAVANIAIDLLLSQNLYVWNRDRLDGKSHIEQEGLISGQQPSIGYTKLVASYYYYVALGDNIQLRNCKSYTTAYNKLIVSYDKSYQLFYFF